MYCFRYHRDPLVHGEEKPRASPQHEQYIGHLYTPVAPSARNRRPI